MSSPSCVDVVEAATSVLSLCVRLENRICVVGVGVFDPQSLIFKIVQIRDNEELDLLESIITQVRPAEVVVQNPDSPNLMAKIQNLVNGYDGLQLSFKKKDVFDVRYLEQDLTHLLSPKDSYKTHLSELADPLAASCLAALIVFCQDGSHEMLWGRCRLQPLQVHNLMRLDKAALNALCILPKDGASRSSSSLYGHLNKCKTVVGSRRLLTWITQPLVELQSIRRRHAVVHYLMQNPLIRQRIQGEFLRGVPDLDRLACNLHLLQNLANTKSTSVSKAGGGRVTLEDLVRLYKCTQTSGRMVVWLNEEVSSPEEMNELITKPLITAVHAFDRYKQLIEYSIDLKEAEQGCYVISREFAASLKELAEQKEDARDRMENIRKEAEQTLFGSRSSRAGRAGEDAVRLVECTTAGFLLRVTKKDQSVVQNHRGSYKQVRVNKNEFLFTTAKLRELVDQFEQRSRDYDKEQTQLLAKALSVASTFWPAVENLATLLATLDILTAFAHVATTAPTPYVRPVVEENGSVVELRGCRHALVECAFLTSSSASSLSSYTSSSYIPNDIYMDRQHSRLHVVTGPNMGGKSTYIRQVALTSLLAQIGCLVPCTAARLPIFTQLMCRVGASDNQLRGVSTFMSEMVEASVILKTCTDRSLVIVDELGRGTSTYEGFGLAWAIAKELVERVKCFCLFATHFHEMARLEQCVGGVKNSHVTAAVDSSRLTFLYRVEDGCADQSYGIHVAKIARLPEKVVARAEEKSNELEYVERHQVVAPTTLSCSQLPQLEDEQKEMQKSDYGAGVINLYTRMKELKALCENIFENKDCEEPVTDVVQRIKQSTATIRAADEEWTRLFVDSTAA